MAIIKEKKQYFNLTTQNNTYRLYNVSSEYSHNLIIYAIIYKKVLKIVYILLLIYLFYCSDFKIFPCCRVTAKFHFGIFWRELLGA